MNAATRSFSISVPITVMLAWGVAAGAAVWNVSTVSQLDSAMAGYASGDEIVINPGTYNLNHGYYFTTNNVTIRSSTGNYNDVILYGGGMNNPSAIWEGLNFPADNVTIKNITVSGFYFHGIHLQPGADNTVLDGVHTLNCGERHIKGGAPSTVNSINNGLIQNCFLEQTEPRQNGLSGRPDNYVGGVDLLGATNFIIRDNVAMHIEGFNSGDAGIFLWQNIVNPTIERNVLIGCNKGIALGNPSGGGATGGIVRNNFIVRDDGDAIRSSADEIGLEICNSTNTKVYNNTIYSVNPTGGTWNEIGNIIGTTAQANWFVDGPNGDLHLTANAIGAIDAAAILADVPTDFDQQLRLGAADVGADEIPEPATLAVLAGGTLALLRRRK